MTVVVYKHNAIASDSRAINGYGSVLGEFKKCGARKIDGTFYFFGATGETAYCQKFMDWCEGEGLLGYITGGEGLPLIEPPGDKEHCTGMVCFGDTCLRFEDNARAIKLKGEFFTLGSGDMYAAGACEVGMTALRAVEAAVVLDSLSGGSIWSYEVVGGVLIGYHNDECITDNDGLDDVLARVA